MGEGGGFLGVERSLTGRRWRQRLADDRIGLALAQRLAIPEILGRVLAARGIDAESAERFLSPTLREQLPDPSGFKDMDAAGGRVMVYVPDRIKEGYGPNAPALLKLQSEGVSVAVTVDCGITAHAPLATAAAAGLDVVVIDHHVGEPELPRAVAVVNPNRLDEQNPYGVLAAVGVAF